MKYLLTAACLLIVLMSKAQIVNIPDSNFKYYLLNYEGGVIDANHDGEIQVTEAEAIIHLWYLDYVNNRTVKDFTGIRAFTNMMDCKIDQGIADSAVMDLNGMQNLQRLSISGNITSPNLAGCSGLISIGLTSSNNNNRIPYISSLNVSDCINLESLTWMGVGYDSIVSIDLTHNRKLRSLSLAGNFIDVLDLTKCDSLPDFDGFTTLVRTLDISGLKKMNKVMLLDGADNLIARNCTGLTEIKMMGPIYNILDVTGCTNLRKVSFGSTNIPSLDFSTCPNLSNLNIGGLSLRSVNLKNGSTLSTMEIRGDSIKNICADEFEIDEIKNYIRQNQTINSNVNVSSFCSFFPGGNYNTITGKARIDINNNGCDSTDRGMPNVALRITDTSGNSLIRYTAPLGDYAHYPYKGIFTLTPYFPYPYFTINPSSTSVTFDTANSLINTTNFCISPNGVHNDLEITFLPTWPPARPGFDAAYTLVYKNRGTTTLSGNVQVNFDNSKMNFVSSSTAVTTQSTGQLSWNYNNLLPFESRTIDVTFNLLPPPINNIGDTITYLAAITPSANDETAFDNSFILPQRVRGSFDPNEKQCLEGSKLDISKIGDYLHYQIHFQNEGTDTAFNVVVTDTLSNKLDWNSFELISSSHPVDVKLNGNKAEFIFQNIKLPYKALNEPASNGWVAFKIKPKPSVLIGDSLNNKAAIYFDFNFPVITNMTTTVVTNSSSPVPIKVEYISISSSNNKNVLNWKAACSNGSAKFSIERSDDGMHFNSIGSLTATAVRCQLPFNFTDNNPVTGKNYYRLKITDADGISFYSKTLVIGNSKTGFEITAISNNHIYFNSSKQQTIQWKIIAADGKLIAADSKNIAAGKNQMSLQLKNAAAGIYTLVVYTNDGGVVTKRFIK